MAYRIEIKKSARKELAKLPKQILRRAARAIDQLADDPRHPGTEKLQDRDLEYRVRVGSYRIVFTIDDEDQLVTIMAVQDRKDVYRKRN